MINIVKEYNNYVNNIPQLISETHYKAEYFIKLIGVSSATYYRKLRENSFNRNEVEKITKALYPKETYKAELLESIKNAEEDIKAGRIVNHEEAMKGIREYLTK